METIIDIIKNKDPNDVTLGEIREFQLHIVEAEKRVSQLQELYRSLTGKEYDMKTKNLRALNVFLDEWELIGVKK